MFDEYDIVELIHEIDVSDWRSGTPHAQILKPGVRGTIVMVYPSDPPEYEVEFTQTDGKTLAVCTVSEKLLRRMYE